MKAKWPLRKRKKFHPSKKLSLQGADHLQQINLNAAGIDLGASEHWVCVPAGRDSQAVRTFPAYTAGLEALGQWLLDCGVDTVAMEATGVYWIALFQLLERKGLEVKLVNARHLKNVHGRKTDMLDCQWIQQLHTYGLLQGSFRPEDQICVLRTYLRQREKLVQDRSGQVLHMQKALQQMNVLVHQALSDITGVSGMAILRAIVAGEHNPEKLATMVDRRVRKSTQAIASYLRGDFRPEHVFVLQQALELYDAYTQQIAACDQRIMQCLAQFETKADPAKPLPQSTKARSQNRQSEKSKEQLRAELHRILGVDLTAIEGIGVLSAQIILSEIGRTVDAWPTEKHFTSWLGVCPDPRISGGKVLSVRTRGVKNRVAATLRMSASTLERQDSGMGAYYRRMKGRLGPASAITATAHKLARRVYHLLKFGEEYVAIGQAAYQQQFQERQVRRLRKQAAALGFCVVPKSPNATHSQATDVHVS